MNTLKLNKLVIKLGGACNLTCKYCHCKNVSYEFNPDIILALKNITTPLIVFSGGEPLLYKDIIEKITSAIKPGTLCKLVTNGTLLNQDVVDFLNTNKIKTILSYDGETSSRDHRIDINWRLVNSLNDIGIASLYSPDNNDITRFSQDLQDLCDQYQLDKIDPTDLWLNFPHQTCNNDIQVTRLDAEHYCELVSRLLELGFLKHNLANNKSVGMIFNTYIRKKTSKGVRCFNDNNITLAINGDFLLCPYDDLVVGNIYDGIDWDKVESYIPERCKGCPLWESCMNTCIANITENECYIAKVLNKHFYKLMDKYGYTYEQLEELIKE